MKNILLCEMTLWEAASDGDHTMSFREKLEVAKLLDALHVDVIEVGAIHQDKADALLIRTIAPLLRHSVLSCPIQDGPEDAARAWNAIRSARAARLDVRLPVSPVQMEYKCHRKPAAMLAHIREMVEAAVALCPDVEFTAEDATRAEPEFLAQAIDTALQAGCRTITLCDTAGIFLPEELGALIALVYQSVPALHEAALSVECRDELGMAVACAFEAVRAGAVQLKTLVGGRSFPDLGTLSRAVQTRADAYGIAFHLVDTALSRTIAKIQSMTHASLRERAAAKAQLGLGAGEGETILQDPDAVKEAVEQLGYTLSPSDMAKVYEAFMQLAEQKAVHLRELDAIVANVANQAPPTYQLKSFVTNSGNVIAATAHVTLIREGKPLSDLSVGDGPIDAAIKAVERIIGHHYELDDFQIRSVTSGQEAMGETLVRLRHQGVLYSGRGISTDIIGASIHAYLNALNKIVYRERAAALGER